MSDSNPSEVWLAAPVRTPIGKYGGDLASLSAVDLGVAAANACTERAGIESRVVEEAVFGCARQAGSGPNPARQIAVRAGLGDDTPAATVNQACASGLRAIFDAARAIRLGEAGLILAGGTESMSRLPYYLENARWGHRLGHQQAVDAMYRDGFLDPLCGQLMGDTAENLAEKCKITRREQDDFALESQRRCRAARDEGRFEDELVPVTVPGRKGSSVTVSRDGHPRDGVTIESLGKLPTVFREGGSVTAGNSSGITDGAAAILVASPERARELGITPAARIVGWSVAGVDPAYMGIGPVPAVRLLERKTGVSVADIDLVELNEAFAAQVIACNRELSFDPDRLNVNGGSIAMGHPIGCTGTRIVVTLLHEMRRRGSRRGLATLCVSGGMGAALLVEAL